jgi:hypothetical protein
VPARDGPTVGELLADSGAVCRMPFEISSSQRPEMVRWPPLNHDDACQTSRPVHLSERTA